MTYGHLQADCLYTGISSRPMLDIEYGKPLPLFLGLKTKPKSLPLIARNTVVGEKEGNLVCSTAPVIKPNWEKLWKRIFFFFSGMHH